MPPAVSPLAQRIRAAGDNLRKHGVTHAYRQEVMQDSGLIDQEVWLHRRGAEDILVGAICEGENYKLDVLGCSRALVEAINAVLMGD